MYDKFYKTYGHSYDEYESSHKARLDHLVKDLSLNQLTEKKIADMGCGLGFIYQRLTPQIQQNYIGYDAAIIERPPFEYRRVDLNNFEIENFGEFDCVLCFETLEHLTNPYSFLENVKKMLKEDGILYLTIPALEVTHNTIYPGLLYPVANFIQFLGQMAFEIKSHRIHDKNFKQEVFELINKNWNFSKMLFHKEEPKFKNISPLESVNL